MNPRELREWAITAFVILLVIAGSIFVVIGSQRGIDIVTGLKKFKDWFD